MMSTSQRIAILIAAGMAQFLVTVDYWSVAIAMPPMAHDLHVRTIDLQWVITGYVLSFSVMLGIAGPLGDRYGRKKMLLIGIALFGVISAWVGLANTANTLIAARVTLGFGGGLLLPLAAAVLAECTPTNQMTRYMALLTAITCCGAAAGPVLGGVLCDTLGWRWIFFVNVPLSGIAFLMVLLLARESRNPDVQGRLDALGILLITASLTLLSLGIDRIPHWTTMQWTGTCLLGIAFLVGFIWRELKVDNPIIDLRLLANRTFAGYTSAGLFSNSCWCLLVFTATLLLQKVYDQDALHAGIFFLYLSGSVVISSTIAAKLSEYVGIRSLVLAALILQCAACMTLWFDDGVSTLAICLVGGGIGCAWGWSMPQAGAIITLQRDRVGLASGSILTVMIMAGNLVVVIVATMIDAMSGPDGKDYATGIHASYLLGAGLAAAGIVTTVFVLPRKQISPIPAE
ncbi:MAG: MFS transporter [Phycisphaerales bacterium]|nr:MFS transporter [Phycisphaerales bacterium]